MMGLPRIRITVAVSCQYWRLRLRLEGVLLLLNRAAVAVEATKATAAGRFPILVLR